MTRLSLATGVRLSRASADSSARGRIVYVAMFRNLHFGEY